MRSDDILSVQAQRDLEAVVDPGVDMARDLMSGHGARGDSGAAFIAFALVRGHDDNVLQHVVAPNPTNDQPYTHALATTFELLVERRTEFRAAAVFHDVRTARSEDAIEVNFEHVDGFALQILFPYVWNWRHKLKYADTRTYPVHPRIWAGEPGPGAAASAAAPDQGPRQAATTEPVQFTSLNLDLSQLGFEGLLATSAEMAKTSLTRHWGELLPFCLALPPGGPMTCSFAAEGLEQLCEKLRLRRDSLVAAAIVDLVRYRDSAAIRIQVESAERVVVYLVLSGRARDGSVELGLLHTFAGQPRLWC